ncbi:MAG: MBL fold metallo-hydrolase [Lachnospiraceae bacterium]|nr:MBL fold metallo-hydrolase [Lachnospiraceae bacterium]
MKIVNLMENMPGSSGCICEHGLSFYIETKKHCLLVDTGASDRFIENAEKLGVDLRKVDTVILSHGHYDHGGGLPAFLELNQKAKIYIRDKAFGDFYHRGAQKERYIGIEKSLRESKQIMLVKDHLIIDDELSLFTHVTGRKRWPSGNLELQEKVGMNWIQDRFDHEQYLIISYEEKEILISGCAHNGILNIMEKAVDIRGKAPDVVISGFHMMQKNGYSEEDLKNIRETAYELKKYPTHFFTGHCTDVTPFELMKEIMGDQLTYAFCGDTLDV